MKIASILTILSLLGLASLTQAAPFPKGTSAATNTPVPAKLLRSDPLLQTAITVDAVEVPIKDVLASLKSSLKLDLTAEQNVADQRVTLHVTSQPAYVLMQEILLLLSHNTAHPYGYHWGLLERSAGERPDYQLWRDMASVAQEQEERDYPRRELALFLHDMHQMAQLPPQEATGHQTEMSFKIPDPDDPYNKAFRTLTDDQLDALANGESVPLDPSLFPKEIANLRQEQQDWNARQQLADWVVALRAKARAARQPDPYPDNLPITLPSPELWVLPADKDRNEEFPDWVGKYDVYLVGVLDSELILDTYNTAKNQDPLFLPPPADSGPLVDLAPYLAAKTVTEQQRGSLGFTLQSLAKAAHINIYGESFLRTGIQNGLPHPGLTILQGSVLRLVAQICALWDCHAEPVQGGYLFWSRTWAQDRELDVPERLIAPWRQRLAKNGELSLYDRAEIDAALTWPQVALTLDVALPEAGKYDAVQTYRMLDLFGSLTPTEQTQALSSDGLSLLGMSARGQAALAEDYKTPLRDVPSDQLASAVLRFQTEDDFDQKLLRVTMSLDLDGHELLNGICIMPINSATVSKSAK